MLKLVFATNNAHKMAEVQSIIGDKLVLQSLSDIGCNEDIPETGTTFRVNAQQKTDYLVRHYAVNCFADDSGLEIDALAGEPGVYSARYAGSRDMEANIDLVLEKLADVADDERQARFKTVISLYQDGQQHFFEGYIEGLIIHERRGVNGFGYDPIFIPNGYDKTFAEMSAEEKNTISHRAIAVQKLAEYLKEA